MRYWQIWTGKPLARDGNGQMQNTNETCFVHDAVDEALKAFDQWRGRVRSVEGRMSPLKLKGPYECYSSSEPFIHGHVTKPCESAAERKLLIT
jgi:hypothetical protein